jgi:hypothetical protein
MKNQELEKSPSILFMKSMNYDNLQTKKVFIIQQNKPFWKIGLKLKPKYKLV